jgi:hypothetical protein
MIEEVREILTECLTGKDIEISAIDNVLWVKKHTSGVVQAFARLEINGLKVLITIDVPGSIFTIDLHNPDSLKHIKGIITSSRVFK